MGAHPAAAIRHWTSPKSPAAAHTAAVMTLSTYAAKWVKERNVKYRTRLGYESLLKHPMRAPLPGAAVAAAVASESSCLTSAQTIQVRL
jgi:hypothetical protein